MNKLKTTSLISLFIAVLAFTSCAPTYLPCPKIQYPITENKCTFGVQNMDQNAKVEMNALTCHYDGFDVKYKIMDNLVVSLEINNNTNKSLIIDKSKCYVLYDGYSTQLFKDVRSSRSTTFNNVQDAINNVQTNEAGISMTIPSYSKWELPIQETNAREIKKLPLFNYSAGVHALTPYDNQETVEFVIPYTFDYSLAKWETCRNRIYVNSIEVKNGYISSPSISSNARRLSSNQYLVSRRNGEPDMTEVDRVDAINKKRYKKHKIQNTILQVVGLPFTCLGSLGYLIVGSCFQPDHQPPVYNKNNR